MASTWIIRRQRRDGGTTYRVLFRLGGRESMPKHGGSFRTMREARIRRDWIAGELAALRVPSLELGSPAGPQTLGATAAAWRASRVDVAEGTAATHRVNLRRILPALGDRDVHSIEPADVAAFISRLHAGGLKRESIRKTVSTVAMVLDFAGRTGENNPARDRLTVKLPREAREEPKPPTAEQVLAIHRLLAPAYRLPLLVLDATGMRVGELEALTWGDVDEARSRWRVSQAVAKTGQARWVAVPEPLFTAVLELVPRDDRTPERRGVPGRYGRSSANRHRARMHGGGRAGVLAA
jgi:integrase